MAISEGARLVEPASPIAAAPEISPSKSREWALIGAPLTAGAALVVALTVLSAIDSPAHLAAWAPAIKIVIGLSGMSAMLGGGRLATTLADRRMRLTLALAAIFFTAGQLGTLVSVIAGRPLPASIDAIPLIGLLLVTAACWVVGMSSRFTFAEQVAVALDSAVVFFIAGAATLVLLGGLASDGTGLPLAYTVVFAGALGAMVVLNLALAPRRFRGGWVAIMAGIVPMVAGSAMEVVWQSNTWGPQELLLGAGATLCGYGGATWTQEADPSARFRALATRVRAYLPLAAVAFAPLLVVGNELTLGRLGGPIGLIADSMLAVVLLLCVIRQTMLLGERDRIAAAAQHSAHRASGLMDDLVVSETRFRSLVTNSSDVYLIISPAGIVSYQSPAVERVLGYPPDDRLGRQIFELTHPDDIGFVQSTIAELIATPGSQRTIELRTRHADGSWRTLEATGRNLVEDPAVQGIVVNYRDVTERKRLEEQLTHQAFHDPLTGLANRGLFTDRVDHALKRREGEEKLAVLFMDLDDFKEINDSLGHAAGDLPPSPSGSALHCGRKTPSRAWAATSSRS